MNPWLLFLLGSLSVFRLSEMASSEEGPFEVFKRMRAAVPASSNFGRGIRCPLCWSQWLAFLATGVFLGFGWIEWVHAPLWSFGMSGFSTLLSKAT